MKNKKGFTLIELLAVIVILAIIMVIAVPKILDVIESSRKSAARSSIELVKDAIKTQVTTGSLSGTTFEKTGDCYEFNFADQESGNAKKLALKNKEKIGGSIKYCNGKFEEDTLTFDGKNLSSNKPIICKRATTLHTETCTQTDTTYYCSSAEYTSGGSKGTTITYGNLGSGNTLVSGDAFDCDVNGDGTYDSNTERFYYVTDLEGNNNVAVLIYYNNVSGGQVNNTNESLSAYDSTHGTGTNENWHGPITAVTNLPTNSQWGNVSLTKKIRTITNENRESTTNGGTLPSNFSYDGYAARLLTAQEVNRACGIEIELPIDGEIDTCNYLMENTKYSSSSIGTLGYWLENPAEYSSSTAWVVDGRGRRVCDGYVSSVGDHGVRPAIEVPKTRIEY